MRKFRHLLFCVHPDFCLKMSYLTHIWLAGVGWYKNTWFPRIPRETLNLLVETGVALPRAFVNNESRPQNTQMWNTRSLCVFCRWWDMIWKVVFYIYIYWQYPWYSCIFFVTYFLFDQNKYASYFIVPCGVGLGLYTPRNSSRRI